MIDPGLLDRCYRRANAAQWRVPPEQFSEALVSSAARAFAGRTPTAREIQQYLDSLHLEDLGLACACAAGDERAWEHFILQYRPGLYRAADAIEPGGGARDLADSLYAELFGLRCDEQRTSLFRYFHGRSALGTWLRAVLAQRHVDRMRSTRRLEELPDPGSPDEIAAPEHPMDLNRQRHVELMRDAMRLAVQHLPVRDRLRLGCYYSQGLTLAETGRLLREHEATCSRHLARSRKAIKEHVERQLREEHRLSEAEITECFSSVVEDAGSLDVRDLLDDGAGRKEPAFDRSK